MDKTALSYWHPKLVAAGLPTPKTLTFEMPSEAQEAIWSGFDGKDAGNIRPFVETIRSAANEVGWPCFLRTDHTSGKHNWEDTCFLSKEEDIAAHLFALAEYSEMAGFPGLPWNTWVVREFLPVKPFGYCERYGKMPVNREFRFFVQNGDIKCWHPYWPEHALEDGLPSAPIDFVELCRAPNEPELRTLASAAGKAVGGTWSVDILETRRGWFVTDMAEAHKSFHWEGCPLESEMRAAA